MAVPPGHLLLPARPGWGSPGDKTTADPGDQATAAPGTRPPQSPGTRSPQPQGIRPPQPPGTRATAAPETRPPLTFLCFLAIHLSQLFSMSSHLDSRCRSTSKGSSSSLGRGEEASQRGAEPPLRCRALPSAPADPREQPAPRLPCAQPEGHGAARGHAPSEVRSRGHQHHVIRTAPALLAPREPGAAPGAAPSLARVPQDGGECLLAGNAI